MRFGRGIHTPLFQVSQNLEMPTSKPMPNVNAPVKIEATNTEFRLAKVL